MIKVAISDATSPEAGELIRILVNHPDVEIAALIAPGHEGKPVLSVHHGLLGEQNLNFTSSLKPDMADVIFLTGKEMSINDINNIRNGFPDLKIIAMNKISDYSLSSLSDENEEDNDIIFALPEINRKALVRGASAASIPSPIASLALVPLYPLALNLLLSEDIHLNISAPADLLTETAVEDSKNQIEALLKHTQKSFNGNIIINPLPPTSKRGIELTAEISSPLDLQHLIDIYNIYDDHNFSFAVLSPVKLDDVKGTEKILVSLSLSSEGQLNIKAVADGRLRGSAGEAVHVMNLMFGLHEKTGLYLKPYAY